MERFTTLFPRIVLEVIEGVGHWVHAEKPMAFVAALRRALGEDG